MSENRNRSTKSGSRILRADRSSGHLVTTHDRLRYFLAILSITILFASLSPIVNAQSTSVRANRFFNQGRALYKKGSPQSLTAAVENFNQAYYLFEKLRSTKQMANARAYTGRAYRKLEDLQNALNSYTDAANLYKTARETVLEAAMYNNIGAIYRDDQQFREAIRYYQFALQKAGRRRGSAQARTYSGLADSLRMTGRQNEAINNYKKSISIWRGLKNNNDKIRAYYGIALAYFGLGDSHNFGKFGNQAIALARQLNKPEIQFEVLENLAQVYDDYGLKKEAVGYRLEAVRVYKRFGRVVSETDKDTVVNNLADIYYRTGELSKAREVLSTRLRANESGSEFPLQSYLVGTLCEIETASGNYKRAVANCQNGIRLAREAGDRHSFAYNNASLGFAFLGTVFSDPESYTKAQRSFQAALETFKPGENPAVEGKALAGLIVAYSQRGLKNLAFRAIQDVQSRKLDRGNDIPAIQVLRALGIANAIFGQSNTSIQFLEKANDIAKKRGNRLEAMGLLGNLGFANLRGANYEKAIYYYKASASANKTLGNRPFEANSLSQLAWASFYAKKYDQALEAAGRAVDVGQGVPDQGFKSFLAVNVLHVSGKVHFGKAEYAQSLEAIQEALLFAKKSNNKEGEKHFLMDISEIYQAMGNKKQAKKFRKQARKIK